MGKNYRYDKADSVRHLRNEELPTFVPDLSSVVLESKAELTDFLSCAPIPRTGHVISDRVKQVLEGFRLPPHRFFPVNLERGAEQFGNYWWLHLAAPADYFEALDFAQSKFQTETDKGGIQDISVTSREEFRALEARMAQEDLHVDSREKRRLSVLEARFDPVWLSQFDLLMIWRLCGDSYCRDSVRTALEGIGSTGIEFRARKRMKLE
jgi:hypothetical protein